MGDSHDTSAHQQTQSYLELLRHLKVPEHHNRVNCKNEVAKGGVAYAPIWISKGNSLSIGGLVLPLK